MKKLMTFICFMIIGLAPSFGQNPMVGLKVGEKVKGVFEGFLENKGGALFVLMERKSKFYLRKFDSKTLVMLEEWELDEYEHENKSLEYVCATSNEKGFYVVWEAHDRSEDRSYFVKQLITRQGESGEVVEIAIAEQVDRDGRAEMYTSQDSSKVAIFIPPIEKRAPQVFVYDNQWNLLWEAKAVAPNEGDLFKIAQVDLTNDGDLLIVGYSYDGYEKSFNMVPSSRYTVIKMSKNKTAKTYSISHLGKVFHSVGVKADLREGYIVTGFYSDTKREDAYGMFYAKLNPISLEPEFEKLQLATDIYKTIAEDLGSTDYMGMYGVKRGFTGMKIKDFAQLNNGLFCVVAERDYFNYGGYNGHVFEELVVASFDAEGESVWLTVVPKIQSSGSTSMESYFFHEGADAIYLVYNDALKNSERINNGERAKRATSYGGGFGLIAASVSPNGELKMEVVGSMKETGAIVRTKVSYSPNKSELMLKAGNQPIVLIFK